MDSPIQADITDRRASNTDRSRARILNEHKRRTGSNEHQESTGPLREIISENNTSSTTNKRTSRADGWPSQDQQDSLYKYINWEDPLRTLGAYFGALGALLATHYYPWTQLALKYGAIALGVVSVTEFANRQFTSETLLARLRPRQYRTIPESTLNATLKDIHDFVQYAVVKLQKVVLGQDLDRTFAAFLVLTGVYFLSGILNPFGFAVLGLTSLFIAPLVTSSRGREVAQEARVQAEKLGNAAAENASTLVQEGKAKAAQGSAKVQETAAGAQQRAGNLVQGGQQTAANAAGQAQDTASRASQATAQNVRKLPEIGSNLFSTSSGADDSASSEPKNYTHEASLGESGSGLNYNDPSQRVNFTTQFPTTATSGQGGGDRFGSVPGTVSKSQVSEETA